MTCGRKIGNFDCCSVVQGDCLELTDGLDVEFDLVLTDPPYGISYVSNAGVGSGTVPITNDGARLSLRLYRNLLPRLKAKHLLWFTRWDAWPDVWEIIGQWFPMRGLLVWEKGAPGMGDLSHWGPSYELIASAGMGHTVPPREGSVLRYNTVPSHNRNHPTEKPSELLEYLIAKMFGVEMVFDPFAGSGSTLVAAKKLGRHFLGFEISAEYCAIARERLARIDAQPKLFEPKAEQLALV